MHSVQIPMLLNGGMHCVHCFKLLCCNFDILRTFPKVGNAKPFKYGNAHILFLMCCTNSGDLQRGQSLLVKIARVSIKLM